MKQIFTKRLIIVLLIAAVCGLEINAQPYDFAVKFGLTLEINSKELAEKRKLSIYLPESYERSEKKYPVVYVLDGEHYFLHTVTSIRTLAGLGKMPESIVVAVHNTNREMNMTPPEFTLPGVPKGGADRFLAFFEKELVPKIEKDYRTEPLKILIGHSHGGLFGVYSLINRPKLFNWYLILDAPLALNEYKLVNQVDLFFSKNPDHVGRIATAWASFSWKPESWKKLLSKYNFFTASSFEVNDENHESMYFLGIYKGLKQLFYDYKIDDTNIIPLVEIEQKNDIKFKQYGYSVPLPKTFLERSAEHYLFGGDAVNAKAYIDKTIKLHGAGKSTDRLLNWYMDLVEHPLEETPAQLAALPLPTVEEIKPFLGEWKSDRFVVSFEAKDSEFESYTSQKSPQGTMDKVKNVFVRILPDRSLQWGYRNLRHPRSALITFTVKLSNNKLIGKSGFVIKFPPDFPVVTNQNVEFKKIK